MQQYTKPDSNSVSADASSAFHGPSFGVRKHSLFPTLAYVFPISPVRFSGSYDLIADERFLSLVHAGPYRYSENLAKDREAVAYRGSG